MPGTKERILIFGTGSIGSIYACLLSRAGSQVVCICRSNYMEAKEYGLRVTSSIFGDLHCFPTIAKSVNEAVLASEEPYDFVLLCTKATPEATLNAINQLKSVLSSSQTALIIIQNGLGVEHDFYSAFPGTTIISGVVYMPTTQIAPACYNHSEMELLHVGIYYPEKQTPPVFITRMQSFTQLLRSAGATVYTSEDIQRERWIKIVANGALNPICALSRCRDRELLKAEPITADVLRMVMGEIVAVATAAGYGDCVNEEVVDKQFDRILTRPYPGVEPSMMADALDLRSMEVQAVIGEIVNSASENQVEVPLLRLLFVLLQGLNNSFNSS